MNIDIRMAQPEKTEFTLMATFTLSEWKKIKESLSRPSEGVGWVPYPMSTLANAIYSLVEQVEAKTEANLADRNS